MKTLKLALASGFAIALALLGDRGEQGEAVASQAGRPAVYATLRDAYVPPPWALPPADPGHPDVPGETSLPSQDLAASAFAGEVVRLSAEADGVDRLWQAYKAQCGVRVGRQYDFGREWFSIWDLAAQPTIEAPGCADALLRVLQAGEAIRGDLLRARATARRAVLGPGTEIGMLRWHALQWP